MSSGQQPDERLVRRGIHDQRSSHHDADLTDSCDAAEDQTDKAEHVSPDANIEEPLVQESCEDLKKRFLWALFVRIQEEEFYFWANAAKKSRSDQDSHPSDVAGEAIPERRRTLWEELRESSFWRIYVRKQQEAYFFWADAAKKSRSDQDSHPCDVEAEAIPEKRRKCEDETEKLVENIEDAVAKLLRADNLGPLQPRLRCLQKQLNSVLDKLSEEHA